MMRTYVRFLLDPMNVQQVVMPVSEAVSWTVLGDDGDPIESVETYLTYLSALERSPNTQRGYATSLKPRFEFLEWVDIGWADVGINEVALIVSWLRAPADNVIVLDSGTAVRLPATINRHLAAVFGFYEHHARSGVEVAAELVAWRRVGRGSYKPFLHHITKGRPVPTPTDQADGAEAGTDECSTPKNLLQCSQPPNTPGIGSSWRCWRRPGCESAKPSGCATAIS